MNYHNIFIRNLAKSLKASRTPATDYVSARNAYAIYQGNPRKTESEEVNVDSTLSETEAQLHQSLERCKSIYGLIENSTKDFESEVKMIERIFNKYNALAKNLSQFDFAKKMSLIADEFKEEEMEKPKKHKPKSKPYVLQDRSADDEAEREEREFWRDLHTCTARTLSGEKPMYHRLLGSKSEQQYEEEPEAPRPVFQPVEDNDYPDPEETDSTYLAADSSTGIAENRPHQIRADTMDNAVSGMSTMTADEASEKSAEDSASDWDSESSFSQPTVPFITSEIHRDNMRRNKQDDSLSTWSKRADHERSRVENLFRTRYAKLLKQAEDKGNLHAVEEESESSNADEPKRRGGMSRKGKQQVIDHGQRAYVHMETTSQRVYMSPKCDDDCKKEKEEEQGSPSCKKEDVCKKRPPKPKCRDPNVPEPCTIIGDTPKSCDAHQCYYSEDPFNEARCSDGHVDNAAEMETAEEERRKRSEMEKLKMLRSAMARKARAEKTEVEKGEVERTRNLLKGALVRRGKLALSRDTDEDGDTYYLPPTKVGEAVSLKQTADPIEDKSESDNSKSESTAMFPPWYPWKDPLMKDKQYKDYKLDEEDKKCGTMGVSFESKKMTLETARPVKSSKPLKKTESKKVQFVPSKTALIFASLHDNPNAKAPIDTIVFPLETVDNKDVYRVKSHTNTIISSKCTATARQGKASFHSGPPKLTIDELREMAEKYNQQSRETYIDLIQCSDCKNTDDNVKGTWKYPDAPTGCQKEGKRKKRQERDKNRCDPCDKSKEMENNKNTKSSGNNPALFTYAETEPLIAPKTPLTHAKQLVHMKADDGEEPEGKKPFDPCKKKEEPKIYGRSCGSNRPGPKREPNPEPADCFPAPLPEPKVKTPADLHIEKIQRECVERARARENAKQIAERLKTSTAKTVNCAKSAPVQRGHSESIPREPVAPPAPPRKAHQGVPEPLPEECANVEAASTHVERGERAKPTRSMVPPTKTPICTDQPEGCKKPQKEAKSEEPSRKEVCKPPTDNFGPQTVEERCKKKFSTMTARCAQNESRTFSLETARALQASGTFNSLPFGKRNRVDALLKGLDSLPFVPANHNKSNNSDKLEQC